MSGGGKFLSRGNLTPNPFPRGKGNNRHRAERNVESRGALYSDPHLDPLPYRERGRETRWLVSREADYFGAAPFDFGAVTICHRGQIVVDGTVGGGECERDFGFARSPFLAA